MVVNLANYDNGWFIKRIGAGLLKRISWYFFNILFFKNSYFLFSGIKIKILRLFGCKIGKFVLIKPGVSIKYPWKLNVGDFCWIGEGVWIDNLCEVSIGNNVCISQGAMLLTGNHDFTKSTFDLVVKPIILHDGVWIGAKAVVCPGVVCESHSVLTVQSVATKNLNPFTIYQGNPAMAVKQRKIKD